MPQLARYMRETINVPFSFAMMESESGRSARVTYAANVLHTAAKGLVDWKELTGQSDDARAQFVEYAKNLERHVDNLQTATADASYHLEAVRQACNACHRHFRLANRLDVMEGVKR